MMKKCFKSSSYAFPLLLTGLLAGCSGGGNSGPALVNIEGQAANSYLYNARVCLDTNENQRCDDGEPTVQSGLGGRFVLANVSPMDRDQYALVVEVDGNETLIGEGGGTQVGRDFVLEGVPGRHDFVSPYTTLIRQQMREQGLPPAEARQQIAARLGIDDEELAEMLEQDYVANYQDATRQQTAERMRNIAGVVTRTMNGLEDGLGPVLDSGDLDERLARREAVLAAIIEQLAETVSQIEEGGSVNPDLGGLAEAMVTRCLDNGLYADIEGRVADRGAARGTGPGR